MICFCGEWARWFGATPMAIYIYISLAPKPRLHKLYSSERLAPVRERGTNVLVALRPPAGRVPFGSYILPWSRASSGGGPFSLHPPSPHRNPPSLESRARAMHCAAPRQMGLLMSCRVWGLTLPCIACRVAEPLMRPSVVTALGTVSWRSAGGFELLRGSVFGDGTAPHLRRGRPMPGLGCMHG